MNNVEYNYLINNYQRSAVKICIEKCCDYKFIFFLNEYQTLGDLYNYVISFYSHITEPIHLYVDRERQQEVPNNNYISIRNYITRYNILSASQLDTPVVYKFYMDLCSKEKHMDLHK
jgi:hypothetical protein|tara:strand:+ start:696 stop:1046 length:351 start_codon:yes stop_codon:yes gene_type:complete